jgi:RNA polymerase sigma factor (sigma-70 family)
VRGTVAQETRNRIKNSRNGNFFIFQAWGINVPELESMGVGLSDEEDRKQFAGIVVPHLSEAFAVASWLTGNRTDAEDVVQEACLRAFRAIGSFAGVNARAWVLTIVRHTAYSWLAKNRPSEIVAVEDFLGEERLTEQCIGGWSATVTSTPETALLAKLDVRRLEAAIAALPLAFREVLILRDLQGLEYREIAEVTTLPVGTVMSRLARARRRIIGAVRTNDA